MAKLRLFFRKVYEYDVHGLASELAFTFLLTLFPLLVIFVTILGLLQDGRTIQTITDQLGKFLPAPIFLPIDKSIEKLIAVKSYKIIFLSLVVSFFSSLTFFGALSKALRHVSKETELIQFWEAQWINFRLLVMTGCLFLLYFYLTYGLFAFEKYLYNRLHISFFRNFKTFSILLISAPYCVSLFLFYYSFVGKKKSQFRKNIHGSIFASILVLLLGFGFQYYLKIKNIGVNYSFAYELLSKMVVLMLYAYLNATFFIWGHLWNQIESRKKRNL